MNVFVSWSVPPIGGVPQANRTQVSAASNAGSPADALAQSMTIGPSGVIITFSGCRSAALSVRAGLSANAATTGAQPIGPKLAEGRDSEIFEHGRDKVLRVARNGRSLVAEAEIVRYARSHGYPCPDVYDAR